MFGGRIFGSDENEGEIVLIEENGRITLDTAKKMLTIHAEAVGRCRELSSPTELTKNMRLIFKIALDYLKNRYLDIAMDV